MQRVTSKHNPRLREAIALIASSRDRRKAGKCVLEGEHLVSVYGERHGAPETLVVTDAAMTHALVRRLVDRYDERTLIVSEPLLGTLATLPASVGILAVVKTPRSILGTDGDFYLLLDEVQDPGNVGSMLRSAAAAGVAQVLLSKRCAFAWSPKVLRAGQGAHFCVDIVENVDLAAWAQRYRDGGGTVVAAVANGRNSLYAASLAGRVALIIGNEGAGLSAELAAQATLRLSIPMPGRIESLNAAAAAAVCLFECARQRSLIAGAIA